MLAAFAEASRVLEGNVYSQVATRNADFLLSALRPGGKLRRAWREGKTTGEVFLEDYAALVLGLIELYQTDFNTKWFAAARELADEMIDRFRDPNGGFFDTPRDGEGLLIRPKDIQDNATPSGNALACEALIKLAAFTGEGQYRDLAEQSLALVPDFASRYPLGFGRWLSASETDSMHIRQVALIGQIGEEEFERMRRAILAEYRPGVIVAASPIPITDHAPALLRDRPALNDRATAYVCEGFVCKQPTNDTDVLIVQLSGPA
jgi:uncharacterized protein YyaL (SSP411 family)